MGFDNATQRRSQPPARGKKPNRIPAEIAPEIETLFRPPPLLPIWISVPKWWHDGRRCDWSHA